MLFVLRYICLYNQVINDILQYMNLLQLTKEDLTPEAILSLKKQELGMLIKCAPSIIASTVTTYNSTALKPLSKKTGRLTVRNTVYGKTGNPLILQIFCQKLQERYLPLQQPKENINIIQRARKVGAVK